MISFANTAPQESNHRHTFAPPPKRVDITRDQSECRYYPGGNDGYRDEERSDGSGTRGRAATGGGNDEPRIPPSKDAGRGGQRRGPPRLGAHGGREDPQHGVSRRLQGRVPVGLSRAAGGPA